MSGKLCMRTAVKDGTIEEKDDVFNASTDKFV